MSALRLDFISNMSLSEKKSYEELYEAIIVGDLSKVEKLIKPTGQIDINYCFPSYVVPTSHAYSGSGHDYPLLHLALLAKQENLVLFFVKEKAVFLDSDLERIVKNDFLEVIKYLVEEGGVDVNKTFGPFSVRLIDYTAKCNSIKILGFLLDKKIDCVSGENNCLESAIESNSKEAINMILEYDIDRKIYVKFDCLKKAIKLGCDKQTFSKILPRVKKDTAKREYKMTPPEYNMTQEKYNELYIEAIEYDNEQIVELLLELGSAGIDAISSGHFADARSISDEEDSADIDDSRSISDEEVDDSDKNPLQMAIKNNAIKTIMKLIERGADTAKSDIFFNKRKLEIERNYWSKFRFSEHSCEGKSCSFIQVALLAADSCDVRKQSSREDVISFINFILDQNIEKATVADVIEFARESDFYEIKLRNEMHVSEIVSLLIRNIGVENCLRSVMNSSEYSKPRFSVPNIIKHCCANEGFDINGVLDGDGNTLLHLAKRHHIASYLIKNGADIFAKNSSEQTPLQCARLTFGFGEQKSITELLSTFEAQYQPNTQANNVSADQVLGSRGL